MAQSQSESTMRAAGPASVYAQRQMHSTEVQDGLVEDQIEKAHALSCEEIIRQHDGVVADLQRDNEMLRNENEMLRQ